MGEPTHRDGVGCPAYGNRRQPALPAKCYPAFWIADDRNASVCPVPGRLGGWLSHPMVHDGLPGGLRRPAIPSSCARRHDTKHLFGGTSGGDSPVWPADALSECGLDAAALCHCTVISHQSRERFSLSYLPAARYPCSLVAHLARSECTEDLLKLAGKGRSALEGRAALAGGCNVRERDGQDAPADPHGPGRVPVPGNPCSRPVARWRNTRLLRLLDLQYPHPSQSGVDHLQRPGRLPEPGI